MIFKKHFVYFVQSKWHLLLVGVLFMSVLPASAVSAASPWDSAINPTSSLTIGTSDRTNSYIQYMRDNCDFYYDLFLDAVSDPNGKWAIVQQHVTSTVDVVTIEWTTNPSPDTTFLSDNPSTGNYSVGVANTNYHADLWDTPGFSKCYTGMGASSILGSTQPGWDFRVFLSTYPVTYPSNYAGATIPNTAADTDEDGLDALREQIQGTSDTSKDTDGDGLSDYVESEWYPNRDDIFCGDSECAYPDPLKRDLYTEVDWMIDDSRIFKPTSPQLSLVKDSYEAHGINAHFDTGQYGGGNQLPTYIQNLHFEPDAGNFDFYDYKNGTSTTFANFDSARYHIWHYMITGYEYPDIEGSSGASYFSDDDVFISMGLIQDNPGNHFSYSSLDDAIAGTILHELGHNLCLNNKTSTLRAECYSSYIDNEYAPSTYNSVMNYSYQMSDLLDYSDGNGPGDHNDLNAIGLGFADFAGRDQGDQSAGRGRLIVGITQSQARQLRKERRIFTHVDKSKRSHERQMFDKNKERRN